MLKLGYKVVMVYNEKFFSMNDRRVEYPQNAWAVPLLGDGPLTVLNNRKAARHMAKYLSKLETRRFRVFRCLYEEAPGECVWQLYSIVRVKDLEANNVRSLQAGATKLAKKVLIF